MSEIRATTVSDIAGTGAVTLTGQYAAKAWVNLNGQGTIAIIDSQNISSLTDNNTGDYSVSLTGSMSNANYSTVANACRDTDVFTTNIYTNNATGLYAAPTSSAFRVSTNKGYGLGGVDSRSVNASVNGDLA